MLKKVFTSMNFSKVDIYEYSNDTFSGKGGGIDENGDCII